MNFEKHLEKNGKRIKHLSEIARESTTIDPLLYDKYDVKRGLRDKNGKGVVAGLTEISEIQSFKKGENGESLPCNGELYYRGYDIKDLVEGFAKKERFGFEEIAFLLLFGKLPEEKEIEEFDNLISGFRSLPPNFVRDIIMKKPSIDMMNVLQRSVLTLYSYDKDPDNVEIENVLRQCLQLIAQLPLISVYGYHTYNHFHNKGSLIIHNPESRLSTAENILHLLRADSEYSALEASLLDMCMVLHMEHGGGNNSSFTTHVVTSSGTDTYSTISASLGSLKGPKHGGANKKVVGMMEDMKKNVKNYSKGQVKDYLAKVLDKKAFDNQGLIYGMGHAVYSLSDPRCDILKDYAKLLAKEKGLEDIFDLFHTTEECAKELIFEKRKIYKGVAANIDFYSGFVYSMLNLPTELYTPIFAIARMVGWSAHRIEELSNNGKIIRPGYGAVGERRSYVGLDKRK